MVFTRVGLRDHTPISTLAMSLPALGAATAADVRAIVLHLYAPATPPAARKECDKWLRAYQERPEAWAMADAFLSADQTAVPGSAEAEQLALFAAMTMSSKIRYDFRDLPLGSHASLRDTLLRHITRLVTRPAGGSGGARAASASGPLVSRLCLALSCLMVQMKELPAADAVAGVLAAFPPGGDGTDALLDILTMLAEEVGAGWRKSVVVHLLMQSHRLGITTPRYVDQKTSMFSSIAR